MLKKVLVLVDGAENSFRALNYAIELCKLSAGELIVMTSVKTDMKVTAEAAPLDQELRTQANNEAVKTGNKALGSANMVYHMLCVGRIKITIISPNCINIMSINAKYFFNLISPISSLHISHSNNINSKIIYLLFQPLPLYTYN